MSSHQVAKEDQEPALVIADAQAVPFTLVQQLLEWNLTRQKLIKGSSGTIYSFE